MEKLHGKLTWTTINGTLIEPELLTDTVLLNVLCILSRNSLISSPVQYKHIL